MSIFVPQRYIPNYLTKKDKKFAKNELIKSRKAYKKGKYYVRKKVSSFKSKKSKHIKKAEKLYNISDFKLNKLLASKTKCKLKTLKKIFSKGQGAYFSSGSRQNQTPFSWAYARLASAISGGKASAVDFKLLKNGCKSSSKALKLAKKAYIKYNKGTRKVPKIKL